MAVTFNLFNLRQITVGFKALFFYPIVLEYSVRPNTSSACTKHILVVVYEDIDFKKTDDLNCKSLNFGKVTPNQVLPEAMRQ